MKSKKSLLVILLILVIGVVGLTLAYFANSSSVDNIFNTQPYGTTVEEVFTAPSNWLPGDTTSKTLTATNTGNVDEAVRIRLNESWKTSNNGTLNGWIHADGTKSTHTTNDELTTDERVAIINFDNLSDWTYSNGYYYYNYKLAPNETTSSLIKSVTFNPKTKLDDTCVTTTNGSTKTITCNSSGDDYDNGTYTLTFDVETVQYNKYMSAWNTEFEIANEKPSSGVDYLLSNAINIDGAEYNAATKSKMFKMTHPATAQTPAQTEYRYIGDNPNNYVYFNCDNLNNQNSTSCEVWRIIGVFDVERKDPNDNTKTITERRIKLVRGSALSNQMVWNSSSGESDWTISSLKDYLNGDYYSSLSLISKSQIEDAKYYLGSGPNNYPNEPYYGSSEEIYSWERGISVYNGRSTSWEGKIALMYPSDMYMVYNNNVDDVCYFDPSNCYTYDYNPDTNTVNLLREQPGYPTLGWIYNSNIRDGQSSLYRVWLLSTIFSDYYYAFFVRDTGSMYIGGGSGIVSGHQYDVRPVLYLSSNVKITDGTGEQNNPYKLGL